MKLLVLLLTCLPCFAQFPYSGTTWSLLSASPSSGPQAFMPNLAEYWEYNDTNHVLTTNAAVTNWIGKLQGTALTNGATSLQPTNSSRGVGFNNKWLTNYSGPVVGSVFPLGTNWTMTIVYSNAIDPANIPGGWGALNLCYNGTNGSGNGFTVELQTGGANKGTFYAATAVNGNFYSTTTADQTPQPPTQYWCVSLCSSNPPGGTGATLLFTNGFWDSHTTGLDQHNEAVGVWGKNIANPNPDYFIGYIEAIYIQTNWIDSIGASNIWYYYTNIAKFPR